MVKELTVKVFSDGANLDNMLNDLNSGIVTGFTTNPSLMKKAGITSYIGFAKEVLKEIKTYPVSFEVFADEIDQMEKEARRIATLAENVYVNIPITNSKGESTVPLIDRLTADGIKVNVTAIFTIKQVEEVVAVLKNNTPSIVSVFAGRIADTGVDPLPIMKEALEICRQKELVELLWASPRETFNIYQADELGVDIITCTSDLIKKLSLKDKDLTQYSLETVQMFLRDSTSLGFNILE